MKRYSVAPCKETLYSHPRDAWWEVVDSTLPRKDPIFYLQDSTLAHRIADALNRAFDAGRNAGESATRRVEVVLDGTVVASSVINPKTSVSIPRDAGI